LVEDWVISPGATLNQVESWLEDMGLGYHAVPYQGSMPTELILSHSGVRLTFDEEDRLVSYYVAAREQNPS
jgi:hypothetical protein